MGEFAVFPGGGVDVPAEAIGVDVKIQGAGVGAACRVEACDGGFCELTCWQIGDLDVEIEGCGGLEVCVPQGDCGIVDVVNRCRRSGMSFYGSKRKTRIGDEDLREIYAAGDRNFSGDKYRLDLVDPAGANLSGANFRNANLAEVNLYQVNFSESDLSNASIVFSWLEECIFKGTILNGAELGSATIRSCDLTGASLIEADLFEIKLTNGFVK